MRIVVCRFCFKQILLATIRQINNKRKIPKREETDIFSKRKDNYFPRRDKGITFAIYIPIMQFPLIIVNKTVIRVLSSVCVIHYYTYGGASHRWIFYVWPQHMNGKLRIWLIHVWMDGCIRHYVASWNRAEVRMSSGTCYTIDSQDYILNNHIFHTVVIK